MARNTRIRTTTLVVLIGVVLLATAAGDAVVLGAGRPHGSDLSHDPLGGSTPHLRQPLPPGFSLDGDPATPLHPVLLPAAPAGNLQAGRLHAAPFPRNEIGQITRAVVNQPLTARAQPILSDATELHPGAALTIVAPQLPAASVHAALFVLQGPGYRGERLVQVRTGVAAVTVTLPGKLSPGTWIIAAEDLSSIQASWHNQVSGEVVVDLGVFVVPR